MSVVARFELAEAGRSRLAVVTLLMYGASAALGCYWFSSTLAALEEAARSTLAQATGMDAAELPANLVREKLIPFLVQWAGPKVGNQLQQMQPLAMFYGFVALNSVSMIVLATSSGTVAGDVANGASRFALIRCDRASWALGKFLGQALLLGAGLLFGATLAGATGIWTEPHFEQSTWLWLFRTSFHAWAYGIAYLGLFVGVSLISRSTTRARWGCLLLLISLWIGRLIADSELVQARFPVAQWLAWIFPGHHELALWSPDMTEFLPAIGSLFAIGATGFALGLALFERRDA